MSQARDAGLSSVTCTIRASPESSPRYVSVCWLYRLRPSTLYDGSEPAFKTPPPFTASNSATRSVLAAPDGVAGAATNRQRVRCHLFRAHHSALEQVILDVLGNHALVVRGIGQPPAQRLRERRRAFAANGACEVGPEASDGGGGTGFASR